MESQHLMDTLPNEGRSAQDAVSHVTKYLGEDFDPANNLAGFHNTFMEHEAEQLMLQNMVCLVSLSRSPWLMDVMTAKEYDAPCSIPGIIEFGNCLCQSALWTRACLFDLRRCWCRSEHLRIE
jgi:hypothetical protein